MKCNSCHVEIPDDENIGDGLCWSCGVEASEWSEAELGIDPEEEWDYE